ncbi:MAG: ribosome assembly cofactor RimP [Firmicutes bacterium]|nr:ribosome assembly cofactor RimP [Bacillota bacterium]MCM1400725.1 ribosome assembly cofactor RimP [Bacteroides sp.]MCM1476419.1 ribosome assembly cofactor RimP [Bacteroides sp.]
MIDKKIVEQIVEQTLQGTDCFPVETTVSADNRITVEIDSDTGVDIDICARINRAIEQRLDRDVEDYELEVGSAGLTAPFKIKRQFEKNIGNEVEVLTRDGRKLTGTLVEINAPGTEFVIEVSKKVKEPGQKRPAIVSEPVQLEVANCKYVRYSINFK